ncbi:hypothetical protein [Peptoniphilus olsenii]|uniref:hypothetical protein n=1 Tax=Peptoniphilus olsenii TaxID=411570 RepID=UPI003397804E
MPPFPSFERRLEDVSIESILKKTYIYSYRTTPVQADSSTPNPLGFPLGMTVVGVVVALSNVISTK